MTRTIHLRNVPESVHRTLKAQASFAGMSLSGFLLAEIRKVAERPTIVELRERVRHRSRLRVPVFAAETVRQERGAS